MALGMLIALAALPAIIGSIHLFGAGVRDLNGSAAIFLLIDRLLLIPVIVERIRSVRLSIRSHTLVIEPFLIIGLIAIIRTTLALTLQAEGFTKDAH